MIEQINERTSRIEHKGRSIFFTDFSGLSSEQLLYWVDKNIEAVQALAATGEKDLLCVSDFRDANISPDVYLMISKRTKTIMSYCSARAVIGVKGLQKHLLNAINIFSPTRIQAFNTPEAALDWLVDQAAEDAKSRAYSQAVV